MGILGKLKRRLFGEILVGEGLVTQEQVDEALSLQKKTGDPLGMLLLDLGYITESDIVKTLSIQYQLPYLRPLNYDLNRKLLETFDPLFLHRHTVLPIDRIGDLVLLLVADLPTKEVLGSLQQTARCDLAIYLGAASEVKSALRQLFPISSEDEERLRGRRLSGKPSPPKAIPQKAAAKPTPETRDTRQVPIETLDFSSDNILSSLNAAWESIFVEAGNQKGEEENGDNGDDND